MKERCMLFFLLFILLSQLSYADHEPGHGSEGDEEREQSPEEVKSEAEKSGVSVQGDVPEGTTVQDGKLVYQGTTVDLSGMSGSTIQFSGSDIIVDNQKISGATTISKEGGTIITDGAVTVIADGKQDIIASNVGTFQAGPVVITNGVNVKYINGCLTADSADSLVESDTIATKLDSMNYCDKTIEVKKADSVWASCVYMEDVENAKITAKTDVTIEADKGSEFKIKDCSTNNYDFKSLSDDSSLVVSKSTTTTVLDLKDVQIELVKNGVTETVESNSSATVEVSRIDGVQKVHMTPVTIYTYDAGNPEKDFSVRAWQDEHDLYLKKDMTDQLPSEVKTCKACSIFDLPNHALEIRGIIDLNKHQVNKGKSEGLTAFFTTANANAKAILTFDDDNAFINDVLILNDAPPYKTVISNYLTVDEALQIGNATH